MASSFFEKLKRGMGIEMPIEEKKEEKIEFKVEEVEKPKIKEGIEEKVEIKKTPLEEKKEKWLEPEGQLAIDIYQTESELIIQSAIAGVKPEDLDISIERDVLTIQGERKKPFEGGDYLSQECYWGKFSRQIILPVEIDPDKIGASLKDGILTIKMRKISRETKRKIIVKS